ncbi:MAG TPA: hypothetical protein VK106_01275 [Balneolaceae bacterium]|nr:hypothetical protein [Balneolaceae bacterium]
MMNEDIVVVGIVFGSIVAIVVISLLFSLIKTWIKNKNGAYDEETFNRMAQTLIQHKKDTERRLDNLEAMVMENEGETAQATKEESEQTIEINDKKPIKEDKQVNKGLKNILKE